MAYKVVKLNYEEIQLWNSGSYRKCLYKHKVSFNFHDIVEIRNSENEKLCYAEIIGMAEAEASFEPVFGLAENQLAFEANMPPAPKITLLIFQLYNAWRGQE